MTIAELVREAAEGCLVLPAIQRNFIWPERKVTLLLDSVMRGYPIGLVLLWETYDNIQYRRFTDSPRHGQVYGFQRNSKRRKLGVVLDGNQRLMSLLHTLRGRPDDGRQLYFDLLSGQVHDSSKQEKYRFRFLTPGQAERSNGPTAFYVATTRLYAMKDKEVSALEELAVTECNLNRKGVVGLLQNIEAFKTAIACDHNVLQASTIDKDVPRDSSGRKTESDVLEAFIRINRQGTPLSHSDLIFSTLKLGWRRSAEALPQFVHSINKGNSLNLDTDFVIRCLLAVSDLKIEFDAETVRSQANVEKIKRNFGRCCNAIRSMIRFVKGKCWCSSSELLRTSDTLVPFVYYLFRAEEHKMPEAAVADARKALYLFSFTGVFSRYAHSRLRKFIKQELGPCIEEGKKSFPLKGAMDLTRYWKYNLKYNEDFLQGNKLLTLHLVRQPDRESGGHFTSAPEMEHIFPRSVLRERGYTKSLIDHFANFWVPVGLKHNRTGKHPKEYFADVSGAELRKALIDRELLDYRRYTTFIESRSERILRIVKRKTGFIKADFA